MLSIRPDVLPPTAVYELQKLCDAVPPFPTAQAVAMLEEELGAPVDTFFTGLGDSSIPIASASLGQVYQCHLVEGGQEVAVKVQRPDMLRTVSLDLYILRQYSYLVEAFKGGLMKVGVLAPRRQFDVLLLETFARASYSELDYRQEGRNQERFLHELVPRVGSHLLHVPLVYWGTTRRKVLTSEFIHGIQLAKSTPEVIDKLVAVGVKAYLTQLLETGFFHSDPHPGNLMVDQKGRLVLIDFGLCASVSEPDTEGMTAAIVHLMGGDMRELIQDAITLGFLPEDVQVNELLPVLEKVYSEGKLKAVESGKGIQQFRSAERRKQLGSISKELNQIFFDFPFTVPAYFALITRALITLEGIALTGDPRFDIFQASYPFAKHRAIQLFGVKNVAKIVGEISMSPVVAVGQVERLL
jgi:aarF domain-containing kinase